MKTIVIGDIHGRDCWKSIVANEAPDRVIFIGDYFDSYDDYTAAEQMYNFQEIIDWKKSGQCGVAILIGNHDYHYMRGITEHYSGYQSGARAAIEQLLEDNKEQDLLWKFVIPAGERKKVLRVLERSNINAYSLFGSEESLMETIAVRHFS
jgi:predicted MPP superfamily phosphohydrolase